jgi:hypothetical protein
VTSLTCTSSSTAASPPAGREAASRRENWAILAATVAHGDDIRAGRHWLARPHDDLGAAPRDVAAKDRDCLTRVLRLLEASWPSCTAYVRSTAQPEIG